MTDLHDSEILDRYYQGDNEALGILYRKYYLDLVFIARKFVPDKQYVEDVVQEVFKDFLKKKPSERKPRFKNGRPKPPVRHVKNYFKGAVVNKCRNNRLIPRNEIVELTYETVEWLLFNTQRSYHLTEKERAEMCERVSRIAGLVGSRKEVFLLTCQGLKPGEIAGILDVNPQNVRSTLSTSLKKIKEKAGIIAEILLDEYYE